MIQIIQSCCFVCILMIGFCACNDSENDIQDFTSLDVVTGLDLIDKNGVPIKRWREPNHNRADIQVYPVPAIGSVFVQSQEPITKLWVIPADCIMDTETLDIATQSLTLTYEEDELESDAILNLESVPTDNVFTLNLNMLSTGFYRIFFKRSDNTLNWQNIFIDPAVENYPYLDLDALCP